MTAPSRDSLTVEGQRFAIVPEWLIDADIGDCAFRLYAVLLRYGQSSGRRMPSRATLARRLRKRSVDTVDRAMKELVAIGAVVVERRRDGKQNLTNLYHVRTTAPGRADAAMSVATSSGRDGAATGRALRAVTSDRMATATPAAGARPDPESLTEEESPPTWGALARECQQRRRDLGLSVTRWSGRAVQVAAERCDERGWPEASFETALLAVAADPASLSPVRVAEAGPWWDAPRGCTDHGLEELESRLDAVDGRRAWLQREARRQLAAEGGTLTRGTVVRRAVELLETSGARLRP